MGKSKQQGKGPAGPAEPTEGEVVEALQRQIPLAKVPVEFSHDELIYIWELLQIDRVAVQPLIKLMIGNIEDAMDARAFQGYAMKPRIKAALKKLQEQAKAAAEKEKAATAP